MVSDKTRTKTLSNPRARTSTLPLLPLQSLESQLLTKKELQLWWNNSTCKGACCTNLGTRVWAPGIHIRMGGENCTNLLATCTLSTCTAILPHTHILKNKQPYKALPTTDQELDALQSNTIHTRGLAIHRPNQIYLRMYFQATNSVSPGVLHVTSVMYLILLHWDTKA